MRLPIGCAKRAVGTTLAIKKLRDRVLAVLKKGKVPAYPERPVDAEPQPAGWGD